MFLLLLFVYIVIMSFGDVTRTTRDRLLVVFAGGFLPVIFKKILRGRMKDNNKLDTVFFKTKLREEICKFEQKFPVYEHDDSQITSRQAHVTNQDLVDDTDI